MARFLYTRSCNDDYFPTPIPEDPYLADIDARLEALYYNSLPSLNEEHDEPRPPFDLYQYDIFEYAERNRISIADAVDYLKSCHFCGNTDIPFASEYCNDRCQDFAIEFCYPCFRNAHCKVCDNFARHNTYYEYDN
jgi:hypothetical protein